MLVRQTLSIQVTLFVPPRFGCQWAVRKRTPPRALRRKPQPSQTRTADTFEIVVVNSGAEATTVSNVGIMSTDRSRYIDVQGERDQGHEIRGPDLPARVEAHGSLIWVVQPARTSRFPRGTELVGCAHRYRRYRKYPKSFRNMIKIYKTPIGYIKS